MQPPRGLRGAARLERAGPLAVRSSTIRAQAASAAGTVPLGSCVRGRAARAGRLAQHSLFALLGSAASCAAGCLGSFSAADWQPQHLISHLRGAAATASRSVSELPIPFFRFDQSFAGETSLSQAICAGPCSSLDQVTVSCAVSFEIDMSCVRCQAVQSSRWRSDSIAKGIAYQHNSPNPSLWLSPHL